MFQPVLRWSVQNKQFTLHRRTKGWNICAVERSALYPRIKLEWKVVQSSFYQPPLGCFFVISCHSKSCGWWLLNEIDFAITDAHSPDPALQFMAETFQAISTWIYRRLFVSVKHHPSLLLPVSHTHTHTYDLSSMDNPFVVVIHNQAAVEGI